ncbi:sialidase family protein [Brachyspira sp. SAP_772]|uniref:sialidase family protein n=1 Tax=Brachyspira sp. SAP_772 TaxID=2608385 RepID=UPI0012F4887F|nr:sialidase family protein [Brachyspira sp. SAP_772]
MSKKIIYLLSLLMALSLVFASCKKNSVTDALQNQPDTPDTTKPPTEDLTGGLFTDADKLAGYATKPVQETEVAKYYNKDYMRNPVITVVNGTNVVIFYEVRYQTPGAGNDVALTGTNAVDIVYIQSYDGGVSFDTTIGDPKYVGGSKTTDPKNSHGAPIVFYDKTHKKIVVVASAGIGLSSGTLQNGSSKIEYSVAPINDDGSVGNFGQWREVSVSDGTGNFKQFGTHSARGTVYNNNLLLPVTLVTYNQANVSQSTFGYSVYQGTTTDNGTTYSWKKLHGPVTMSSTAVKETRIVSATSESAYTSISVPAGDANLYQAANGAVPNPTSIKAGDGSAGTLVVKDWKGATSYSPSDYAGTFDTANGTPQAIVSHVLNTESNLAVRLVDGNFKTQQKNSFNLGGSYARNSKSSSLDILKDGTIVMAAEGGVADSTVKGSQTFYIYFNRYTQAYLTAQTGN